MSFLRPFVLFKVIYSEMFITAIRLYRFDRVTLLA
jgi:hypothetical protein